jgi:hypothetical protein
MAVRLITGIFIAYLPFQDIASRVVVPGSPCSCLVDQRVCRKRPIPVPEGGFRASAPHNVNEAPRRDGFEASLFRDLHRRGLYPGGGIRGRYQLVALVRFSVKMRTPGSRTPHALPDASVLPSGLRSPLWGVSVFRGPALQGRSHLKIITIFPGCCGLKSAGRGGSLAGGPSGACVKQSLSSSSWSSKIPRVTPWTRQSAHGIEPAQFALFAWAILAQLLWHASRLTCSARAIPVTANRAATANPSGPSSGTFQPW